MYTHMRTELSRLVRNVHQIILPIPIVVGPQIRMDTAFGENCFARYKITAVAAELP